MDAYTRKARFLPAVLIVSPLLTVAAALGFTSVIASVISVGVVAVASGLVTDEVASRGRALEEPMFARWGGAPTELALLLSRPVDAKPTASRRAAVEAATRKPLPTLADERADMPAAMSEYKEATKQVRSWLNKDTSNSILADVNASYGFRRNLFANRDIGWPLAFAGVVVSAVLAVASVGSSPGPFVVAAAYNGLLLVVWRVRVTEAWVRSGADLYALRFYDSLLRDVPRKDAA